jgi:methyltransferase (TIGR00027 family)
MDPSPPPVVTDVSDTALWVACLRADESRRKDAIFRDPFAQKLAGERGRRIREQLRDDFGTDWAIVVRTRLLDDLVLESIGQGADRVLNLAAGLDTRPYRLELPAGLNWVEADLPGMIDEKQRLLAGETPRCQLRHQAVDLADPTARAAFLERALDGARRALVLTEGLLVYLEPGTVKEIAHDLHAHDAIAWWTIDLASPAVLTMRARRSPGKLAGSAVMKFAPADGLGFFRPLGWRAVDIRSYYRFGVKWKRVPWPMRLFSFLPDPDPENPGSKRPWGAAVRFARSDPR